MKVFLDTNVIVDYLASREPFCHDIRPIFTQRVESNLNLSCASFSFTTMEYVLKKHIQHNILMNKFELLRKIVEVVPTTGVVIDKAIVSDFKDFEDAVQYFTALSGSAQAIVTRNPKDFVSANDIQVLSPKEFSERFVKN